MTGTEGAGFSAFKQATKIAETKIRKMVALMMMFSDLWRTQDLGRSDRRRNGFGFTAQRPGSYRDICSIFLALGGNSPHVRKTSNFLP